MHYLSSLSENLLKNLQIKKGQENDSGTLSNKIIRITLKTKIVFHRKISKLAKQSLDNKFSLDNIQDIFSQLTEENNTRATCKGTERMIRKYK